MLLQTGSDPYRKSTIHIKEVMLTLLQDLCIYLVASTYNLE